MEKIKNYLALLTAFSAGIMACSCAHVGPPVPDRGIEMPEAYSESGSAPLSAEWWRVFNDKALNEYMKEAIPLNLTLQQAAARLDKAEAAARKAGAARWPSVDLSAKVSRTETHTEAEQPVMSPTTEERYQLGPAASYEIDLWGRVAALDRAAMRDYEAASNDTLTACLSVSAQIVTAWHKWQGLQERLDLLDRQTKTSSNNLELVRLRYRQGVSTALDVWNQKEQMAALLTLRPSLEAQIFLQANRLAALAGRTPDSRPRNYAGLAEPPPLPAGGAPADLLNNRPDVRTAMARVRAADERVAAAIANRLPSLRITGEARYTSSSASALLDNWIWNVAGSMLMPVFDAGGRRAEVARARAERTEWYTGFQQTLLNALREVEDALARNAAAAESVARQEDRVRAAKAVYEQTERRYRNGTIEYLNVVRALERYQSARRDLIGAREETLLVRVELYRALGGGNLNTILERVRDESKQQ
ncbi:MAG: efflux transporter outer membrane subunit [Verrucomicrobiota bacterium]